MPKKRQKEQIKGQYFFWLLGSRSNGVFYADGRSNTPDAGRHSLGTRDQSEALEQLRRLDLVKAVEFGLADPSLLQQQRETLIPLEDGRQRYWAHLTRPIVQGGPNESTVKRYRPVLAKFFAFAVSHNVQFWQQVNKDFLTKYNKWLEDQDYAYATQTLELTTLKQIIKWFVAEGILPPTCLVTLKLRKPQGTTTYCYSPAEVRAIIEYCRQCASLTWLADVVTALALTGLRIGELAGLLRSDIDLEHGVLRLKDTTRQVPKSRRHEARTTKSHRDRCLPLHEDLRPILERLPRTSDGRIFHGPLGGRLKPDTVRNVLTRDVLSGLADQFPASDEGRGVQSGRLHSFRHFFCSMSADNGVPEQLLMSWLGHHDSKMIRTYYHLRQDEARKQMAKLRFLDDPRTVSDGPGSLEA